MRTSVGWKTEYVFLSTLLFAFLFCLPLGTHGQEFSGKKYWICFKDKGPGTEGIQSLQKGSALYKAAELLLTERALQRRRKVLQEENLLCPDDVPVHQPYLDELRKLGVKLHVTSRWFNAASAFLSPEQLPLVRSLSFVREVSPVITFLRDKEPVEENGHLELPPQNQRQGLRKLTGLNYGPSFEQDSVINVPAVHALGINGTGVLVGMLDTGFRWKTHEALKNSRIVAEYDFIFQDSVTADEANDPIGQDSHGTSTLSTIGGFKEGQLIGPAYGASFLLGKTEYVPTETQIEEDNWVAAIEWMESKGVDVVSSSLGYTTFDDGRGYSYSRGDFDGRTAVTSKAAVAAARKGVVVVNSMGNGGNRVGSIIAPADADSIIAAGAVNYSGVLASFSSIGPTNDGRIKPDVVAPGVSIYVASSSGPSVYGRASGTSFSCPLTAGVAALVLSAHPEFTPMQVIDAIRNTASRANRPDNLYGWGIVNAEAAVLSAGLVFSNLPRLHFNDSRNIIITYAASKAGVDNFSMRVHYSLDGGRSFSSAVLHPTSTPNLFQATIPPYPIGTVIHYYIEGADQEGVRRSNPYNAPAALFSFAYGEGDTSRVAAEPMPIEVPTEFVLYQNYPNPFNPSTRIRVYAPDYADAELIIYNSLGEKVRSYPWRVHPGTNSREWDGRDETGRRVSSGVYYYQFRTSTFTETKHMVLIK